MRMTMFCRIKSWEKSAAWARPPDTGPLRVCERGSGGACGICPPGSQRAAGAAGAHGTSRGGGGKGSFDPAPQEGGRQAGARGAGAPFCRGPRVSARSGLGCAVSHLPLRAGVSRPGLRQERAGTDKLGLDAPGREENGPQGAACAQFCVQTTSLAATRM